MSDRSAPGFVERPRCPGCGASGSRLLSLRYQDPRVGGFVESYYGGRVPLDDWPDARYQLEHCLGCGLIWQRWVPDPRGMRLLYTEWISAGDSLAKKACADTSLFSRYALEMQAIAAVCGPRANTLSVLDYGMGWGYWCRMAAAFGFDVVGYEVSEQRVTHAQGLGLRATLDLDDLRRRRFDFINCDQVLEHVADPAGTLQILTDCLAPGGRLRISVPDGGGIIAELQDPAWRAAKDALQPLEHINCFSHHALCSLAGRLGLAWLRDAEVPTENAATSLYLGAADRAIAGPTRPTQDYHRTAAAPATRVGCVVRSIGERSTSSCLQLLAKQLGRPAKQAVRVVGDKPFAATLADSLQAGLAADREWTLCVDADVLPFPGAIDTLLDEAASLDRSVVEVQGLVFDRLFGGWRPAGVHLYRTALLPRALELVDRVHDAIRPETALLELLEAEGLRWRQTGQAFGLHDFEQQPGDLARTSFVHAWKHVDLLPRMLTYWRMRAGERDFDAALQGLSAGVGHAGPVLLDRQDPCYPRLTTIEPLADLGDDDCLRMLHDEQKTIAALGFDSAPVWDWAEARWPPAGQLDRLAIGLRRAVERGVRRCIVRGDNPASATALQGAAQAWGLTVSECTPCWQAVTGTQDLPVLDLRSDGRLWLHPAVGGRELLARCASGAPPQGLEGPVQRLLQRLRQAGGTACLVYGAGAAAAELHRQAGQAGIAIRAFLVSHPESAKPALFDVPIRSPAHGVHEFPGLDIVIASYSHAAPMARRILQHTDQFRGRIWCLDD